LITTERRGPNIPKILTVLIPFQGSTGEMNVLDIVPTNPHQRVPLFIGNKFDVLVAEEFIQGKRQK
jgi:hypothetical protein